MKESLARRPDPALGERERSLEDRRRNLDNTREELKLEKARQLRELERVSGLGGAGEADPDARAGGRPAPRQRAHDPPGRGGDAPRRRPPLAQHPRCDATRGLEPCGRDHSVRRRAEIRRAEGPDHRPRTQHPRARDRSPGSTSSSTTPRARCPCRASTGCAARSRASPWRGCSRTAASIRPASRRQGVPPGQSEIDQHVVEVGEQAAFEANVGSLHPELVKLLGRLKFRTS